MALEDDELEVPPGLRVTMLLCEAAQVVNNKLYILGGGISLIGPQPQALSIAFQLFVPWNRANLRHSWEIDLIDEDGAPLRVNEQPLAIRGEFEAGRPAGLRPGSPLPVLLAITIPPLPYPAGRRFTFRLLINGETERDWQVSFATRTASPSRAS